MADVSNFYYLLYILKMGQMRLHRQRNNDPKYRANVYTLHKEDVYLFLKEKGKYLK